jgi:hypothetical protein
VRPPDPDETTRKGLQMMLHKFHVGQKVRYGSTFARAHAIAGDYEVVGQMPARDGDNQYRIKRIDDPHQRVVSEAELQAGNGSAAGGKVFAPRH